jgi:hypothetical protein
MTYLIAINRSYFIMFYLLVLLPEYCGRPPKYIEKNNVLLYIILSTNFWFRYKRYVSFEGIISVKIIKSFPVIMS